MAKRMFNSKIVDSDAFLDMSQTAQLLYFHLAMRTDDDGFVGNPKKIMRMIGSQDDDIKILLAKNFIIGFQSGVIVIKHHRMNNNWDKYNCRRTQYLDEFSQLNIKENGAYTLDKTKGLPAQTEIRLKSDENKSLEENRIEENRIEENRVSSRTIETDSKKPEKDTFGEMKKVKLTQEEYSKLVERFGEKNTQLLIFELDTYVASKGAKYQSHYATLLNWAKRKAMEQHQKQVEKQGKQKQIV